MSKTIEISRAQFESANPIPFGVFWSEPDSRYMTTMVHLNCIEYNGRWLGWKNAILAAPVVERQDVIDLDAVDWETIQQAADESNWMPNEYMRNEWIADVCNFLKYGRADISAPAPVAVVDERAEFDAWTVRKGRVIGYHGWREDFVIWQARACLDKVKELNQ